MNARALPQMFDRLGGMVLLRYTAASGIALAADLGTFMALLHLGAPPVPSSAASYVLGILVHWLASSRAVFGEAVAAPGEGRARQKVLFAAAALVGLALTSLIVGIGARAGLDPRLAKLAAVGASFVTTWLLRRRVVFA